MRMAAKRYGVEKEYEAATRLDKLKKTYIQMYTYLIKPSSFYSHYLTGPEKLRTNPKSLTWYNSKDGSRMMLWQIMDKTTDYRNNIDRQDKILRETNFKIITFIVFYKMSTACIYLYFNNCSIKINIRSGPSSCTKKPCPDVPYLSLIHI